LPGAKESERRQSYAVGNRKKRTVREILKGVKEKKVISASGFFRGGRHQETDAKTMRSSPHGAED